MGLGSYQKGEAALLELGLLPVLCEVYAAAGQPEKAQECLTGAQMILARDQDWGGLRDAYLAEGMVRACQGRWEEAWDAFQRAADVACQFELRWDEARVYYQWGCALIGNTEQGTGGPRSWRWSKPGRSWARHWPSGSLWAPRPMRSAAGKSWRGCYKGLAAPGTAALGVPPQHRGQEYVTGVVHPGS